MINTRLEIEFSLLGTLIRSPERIGEVAAELKSSDFSEALTERMFEAIASLHSDGAPIDRVTVIKKLGDEYEESVDAAIARESESNLSYYCKLIRDEARLSRLQRTAIRVTEADSVEEAEEISAKLSELLAERPSGHKALNMMDLMNGFYDRYENKEKFLTWGFEKLDKQLFVGLGDFVVLGGYPSAGKTMLSIQFAVHMAREYRVGYFSCETGEKTWTDRLMAHMAAVDLRHIKSRSCTADEHRRMIDAAQDSDKLQLSMIPSAGATVAEIRAQTLNGRYQIIFVDYLQLLRSKKLTRYEQVTEISQGLATMARELGVTVIALAQLSRPEKTGEKKMQRPTMSAFRESGQIEQDADVAMIIYPESMTDNHSARVLSVAKNKEGERPLLKLNFNGGTQTFREMAEDEEDEDYGYDRASEYEANRRVTKQRTAYAAYVSSQAKQMGFDELPD